MKTRLLRKIYITASKAFLASSLLILNAQSADFKIDLSGEISKKASSKVVDGAEKKKIGLEVFRVLNTVDGIIDSDRLLIPRITSTVYENGVLIIKFKLNFDPIELETLLKTIDDFPKIDVSQLWELNSKISEVNIQNEKHWSALNIKSNSVKRIFVNAIIGDRINQLFDERAYEVSLVSQSNEIIAKDEYTVSLVKNSKLGPLINEDNEFTVSMPISSQDAVKIKSLKIKSFALLDSTVGGALLKHKSEIKSNQIKLLLSPQLSEPGLAFSMAQEKLLLSFKGISSMLDKLSKQKSTFLGRTTQAWQNEFMISKVAEIIAVQSLAENGLSNDSHAAVSDFSSLITGENINKVLSGNYREKYKSDSDIGCQKFIPKDFKYDNPAKGFGFDGGNEVNAMMNQIGMANNSVVLGNPDQKTRVITGFISSLTENGGIISNGNTMKDANPIQFTKNAKTVVFNPEKVTVGQSLVRIVGTYDQNSKIKLTNGLGGTKIVDAANINVTCIEGVQSSDEVMQNMYKMLGIMK